MTAVASNAIDITGLLVWLIIAIGGSLLGLLGWIGHRLHSKVDDLPVQVGAQVEKVHEDLLKEVRDIRGTQIILERDIRDEVTKLDRRVTKVEASCDIRHQIRQ